MEEGKIGQEAKLIGQVPGDIAVVKVNARHHLDGGVGGGGSAEYAAVGANIRACPV